MDNSKLLLIVAIIAVIMYVFYTLRPTGCCGEESFWGGYFPVPYMGQPLTFYGRSGLDAATDAAPRMLVNADACNVSPYYCERCKGYRCCCK